MSDVLFVWFLSYFYIPGFRLQSFFRFSSSIFAMFSTSFYHLFSGLDVLVWFVMSWVLFLSFLSFSICQFFFFSLHFVHFYLSSGFFLSFSNLFKRFRVVHYVICLIFVVLSFFNSYFCLQSFYHFISFIFMF